MVAFFGCRLEDLAQVDLRSDLRFDSEAGIYFLRLDELTADEDGEANDGGGDAPSVKVLEKSIKNQSSWRVIPIHSALVRAGAIDFFQAQLSGGSSRPFEAHWAPLRRMHSDRGQPVETAKWSHQISKWGQREFKRLEKAGKIKKTGRETYFHSMRHTFITHLARRGLSEEQRGPLTGHSTGGINSEVYTKLRNDHRHLCKLVEENLGEYVNLLDSALASNESIGAASVKRAARVHARKRKSKAPERTGH